MTDFPLPDPYVEAIKNFEGFTPRSSWDYKQNSVGYGTKAQYPGEVINKNEAQNRLGTELNSAASAVDKAFPGLAEGPRAALTSLTFNAGPGWINSGLGKAVGSGDMDTARNLFTQYVKAGGKTLPGLVDRRNAEAQWFNGAAPMAYADQSTDPAQMLLSAIGGAQQRPQQVAQSAPNPMDRFGAGLQSFLGGNNLPSAIGGLLSGLATGQRQDSGYLNRQDKERAFNELVRQHNQQFGHQNETLAENKRQFELQYNKPQVVFKKVEDPNSGEMVDQPYIVTPGSPGRTPNVIQLDPNTFKPEVQPAPMASSPVTGLTPEETGQIPSGAAFVQGGAQPTINGVPADLRGRARLEYAKTLAQGRAKADLQKTMSAEGDKTQNDIVQQNLDKAITKVNESPFLTTGLVGQLSSGIGGTPAHDLSAMIDPIEANIAFDRLNKIRQENARGAGIGNVTDKDMALLKSVLGSLKQSQSSNELLFNLERLRQTYHKITNPLAPPLPPLARMQRPQQGAPMAPAARTGGAAVPESGGSFSRDAIQQELIRRGVLNANSL